MKIEKVSATIRYSQDTGKGAWKVIELGAEASIGQKDNWKQAQTELYYQLGDQLRALWANASSNGAGAAVNAPGGAKSHGDEPAASEPAQTPRQHWCEQHQTEFKRRSKDGTVWCTATGKARVGVTNSNYLTRSPRLREAPVQIGASLAVLL